MSDRNIVLVGFMGTGKSTVGKLLAKRLKRRWVDIDQEIEEAENRKIADIFEKDGEARFRELESQVVRQTALGHRLVIMTGGGAVIDRENRRALKRNGLVIALTASPETVFERVKKSRHRPLLKDGDPLTEIRRLLDERAPFYREADLTFATDGKSAGEVVEMIEKELSKKESLEFGKDRF